MQPFFKKTMSVVVMSLVLSACQTTPRPTDDVSQPGTAAAGWRTAITDADFDRLRRARAAWTQALKQAQASGYGAQIDALGDFANPDYALDTPRPPAGMYQCRVIKLGAKTAANLDYSESRSFDCKVSVDSDGVTSFEKLDGAQRHIGHFWTDNVRRDVFLGTMVLGDERSSLPYGTDRQRSLVGMVERVDSELWRITLPWPAWEATLELIELKPYPANTPYSSAE